jgi:glycyl-tRNA synthetase alpha subunit
MAITFTIEEIKTYILSQDSLGDVLYNLTEEKIIKANELKEEEEEEDEWEEEDD